MARGIWIGLLLMCCGLGACAAAPKANVPAASAPATTTPAVRAIDTPEAVVTEPMATTPAPEPGETCYVIGEDVRVRAEAHAQSEIKGALGLGAKVLRLETTGDWCRVRYGEGEVGYVHGDYLATACPTARPTISPVTGEGPAIVVYKAERRLELWEDGILSGSWHIGLGWEPEGDKKEEGDGRTPEGDYYVCLRNAASSYYLSLGVSYPNQEDADEALRENTIDRRTFESIAQAIHARRRPPWNTAMGGQIMIHGHGGDRDWTAGCIAVDDEVMDILWARCPLGTQIRIFP